MQPHSFSCLLYDLYALGVDAHIASTGLTGVPVHENDVIMPGGMSYGLRIPRVAQYYQERECDTWEMQRQINGLPYYDSDDEK
jgi:hypothetical protein